MGQSIRFNPLIFYRIFFLLQNTQLFCFPSTHKFTHSKAFCIFKVKCVWIHAANQFPPDGDKWLAGQKESQEAAPSITTMNYSPSLSLNFQRRMIRQRRGRTHNKNAQFVKFEYPISLPSPDSDCHTKLFLILSDLKKRKMNQRWSDITKRTYNFRTMSCFFNAIMIWPERDLIWAGRLRYCRGFVWKTDSQGCGGWKGKKSDPEIRPIIAK